MKALTRKTILYNFALLAVFAGLIAASPAQAKDTPTSPDKQVLFRNVNIFDGKGSKLLMGRDVLVDGNLISTISDEPLAVIQSTNMTVIDGGGRTLMPGLIDLHVHLIANGDRGLVDIEANLNWEDLAIRAAAMGRQYLFEGFTSVRDMGGVN